MFGSQSAWYFQALAGITMTDGAVAFNNVTINPYIGGGGLGGPPLTSVSATVGTLYGGISVDWHTKQGECATAAENSELQIDIGAVGKIANITFASYGTPSGICGNFSIDPSCNSPNSMSVVSKACLGQKACTVSAVNSVFGGDPCEGIVKRLYVEYQASAVPLYTLSVTLPVGVVGQVYIPAVGLSLAELIVLESDTPVWTNGQFVPGVSGVTAGAAVGNDVLLTFASGSYVFAAEKQSSTSLSLDVQ